MRNRVYFAGPYRNGARIALRERRAELNEVGYDVQSRWIDDPRLEPHIGAVVDMGEVAAAAIVVVFADLGTSTAGGMWCEMGMALFAGKTVYVVDGGYELPVFCHKTHVFGDWGFLKIHLASQVAKVGTCHDN